MRWGCELVDCDEPWTRELDRYVKGVALNTDEFYTKRNRCRCSGRYLYRGVIQEKDIVACENAQVTFRYQNNKKKKMGFRTVPGEKFLWLILQHVLPKGFRRARNFGFLHPNSKRLIVRSYCCSICWALTRTGRWPGSKSALSFCAAVAGP